MLVRIGLLGGGDITPLTKLDKLSDAQFYAYLRHSVRNKAIDRLRKRKGSPKEVSESEITTDTESDVDLQEDDLKDVTSTPPFTREEALELALQQALHTMREAYFGEIHVSADGENEPKHKARIQVLEKQNEDSLNSSIVHIRIVEEGVCPWLEQKVGIGS